MATETHKELFIDVATGESIERELTADEIANLPQPQEETNPE